MGIEASVEPDHERDGVPGQHLDALVEAAEIEVDRLLAEDRLAGLGGGGDQLEMGVGRRADQHRVEVVTGKRLPRIGGGARAMTGGERARSISRRVDHHRQPGARMGSQIAGVAATDPPGAEQAEA